MNRSRNENGVRIGIDVGGTFTDFVLAGAPGGQLVYHKEPGTPHNPAQAVTTGLAKLLALANIEGQDVAVLMHGTTIGLNAIIQRKGARIGLVVSEGFRHVLEIARCRMPSSFDLHAGKEEPLVDLDRVFTLGARVRINGENELPTDLELDALAASLLEANVEAVALVLVNGYADPLFEAQIASALESRLQGLAVVSAAAIWPEIREYERTLVACLNTYIQPLMRRYYNSLGKGVRDIGVRAPILVTASNGGSVSLETATRRPVETILSGPAAGVMAATRTAQLGGVDRIITFDMGGTSSDISIAQQGEPEFAVKTDIGGLPLMLPVVAVSAIGAGGGSVVWVDAHGVLKVGPQSAGASPGPVCYQLGGVQPALTDCYLVLGFIDPAGFLGGRMPLDHSAAVASLARVGHDIGLDGDDIAQRAAWGALSVTTASMATELFKLMAQRGLEPRHFALMPFGGAGPTHANLLAEEIGVDHIVIPLSAGTFCAMGAAAADLRRDFVRSVRVTINQESEDELQARFSAMEQAGADWLAMEGGLSVASFSTRAADMKYTGQAYELRVELDNVALDQDSLTEAFHREHERVYAFRDEAASIEIGNARVAVIGKLPSLESAPFQRDTHAEVITETVRVFMDGKWENAIKLQRKDLFPGVLFSGPAIVEQPDTTVVVLPGWDGRIDEDANIHLKRSTSHAA